MNEARRGLALVAFDGQLYATGAITTVTTACKVCGHISKRFTKRLRSSTYTTAQLSHLFQVVKIPNTFH